MGNEMRRRTHLVFVTPISRGVETPRACISHTKKNDQDGSRPRDPRHIYANPLRPELCPVLALAVFWATTSFGGDDRLFPGSNQYERFPDELRRRGVDKDELGTHSMR
ncbi:hypothetical protein F444_12970 [Phytophthora nicotianae P1976]|uniref:Uncharacterized protein n=1 Tax=Phytophthora nicotianae P1976 TaxID=1317066 RepID=A0A080ZV86_PHYNI|nr:hypothetical protein F444_12970 [Phytophthora nicotianae P1976]